MRRGKTTDSLDEPDNAETQLKVVSSLPDPAQLANRQQTTELALLCDTERDVMRQWDLLNARERRNCQPSVFVIDPGLTVRHAAVGTVVSRAPAAKLYRC